MGKNARYWARRIDNPPIEKYIIPLIAGVLPKPWEYHRRMSGMTKRHRRGGVKEQHSIIPGIRKKLQKIAACPHVQAVTPGRISPAVGSQQPVIVFQYFQETGMKLVGKIPGAVQEIFVVTSSQEAALNSLVAAGLIVLEENRPGKAYSRSRKTIPNANNSPPITEASPETIQTYMNKGSNNGTPLAISIGDRLNGQMHHLQNQLAKQAEQERARSPKIKDKQSHAKGSSRPHSRRKSKKTHPKPDTTQASTMEAWLDAADAQGPDYWQKIKSSKDQI